MKLVSAVEHGWLSIGPTGELTLAEADALARAEHLLPSNCLEWRRNRVKFRQYCGVVQIEKQLQIEILPKVFPYQTRHQQRTTLIGMLDTAGDIVGLNTEPAGLGTNSHRLLDVFIRHFLRLLEAQLQQGLLRDYQDIEDTLDQVRGRIDLIRQQRENLFKPQRIACRFSELEADIPVNRLLHSALLAVATLVHSPALRQHIQSLRQRFGGIATLGPGEHLPGTADLNRMQRRYASVVELAGLFLQGQYLDARAGQQQVYSLLFDMNQLFERFVGTQIQLRAKKSDLRVMFQGPRKYLGTSNSGRQQLMMRPDFSLFNTANHLQVILDSKWKVLGGECPLTTLSSSDLYQISTYASTYRCSHVVLLYPEQEGFKGHRTMLLDLERPVTLIVEAVPIAGSASLDLGLSSTLTFDPAVRNHGANQPSRLTPSGSIVE